MADNWKVERGSNGVGFVGMAGVICKIDSLNYTSGGIPVPINGFRPVAVLVNAEGGGFNGYFDGSKIVIYKDGGEVVGTLTDLTLVMIGN